MTEKRHATLPRFTDPSYFKEQPWKEYVFIVVICFGQLITQSFTNSGLTHMYQLQHSFNAPETMTPWYLAGFGMAVGTVILVSGRVGDAYGLRGTLIGGYIWTALWSLLCGIAYYARHKGPDFYIVCRTMQGAGVAFILPNAIGIAGRVYTAGTLRKKLVFGCIGLCAPIGGWLGVVFSGVIAVRTERWDWNYYAQAIFSAVVGILVLESVPSVPVHLASDGKRQSLDWEGSVLVVGSLTLFNFVWNEAPVVGWQKAHIITLLCVSVPMFMAFIVWELKFAKNPLLPGPVLKNSVIMGVLLVLFVGWGAFSINIYHYSILMQQFRHESPFVTGVGITPVLVTGVAAALSCSIFINRRTVGFILLGSMLCFLSTSLILCFAGEHESYWRNTFGMWFIAPFGMDWSFPAGTIMLSEELPAQFQGLAGSLVTVMINYGSAVFLGFAGVVESQLLLHKPDDPFYAWKGALFFCIGLSGLASVMALGLLLHSIMIVHKEPVDSEAAPEEAAEAVDFYHAALSTTHPEEVGTYGHHFHGFSFRHHPDGTITTHAGEKVNVVPAPTTDSVPLEPVTVFSAQAPAPDVVVSTGAAPVPIPASASHPSAPPPKQTWYYRTYASKNPETGETVLIDPSTVTKPISTQAWYHKSTRSKDPDSDTISALTVDE